jgi:hypothetical protein
MTRKTWPAAAAAALLALAGGWSFCAAAPAESATAAASQETYHPPQNARVLRNEDVVAMSKANLGGDLIVLTIEHSPALFSVTPEALIALKGQGVGDAVITAMLRAAMAARGATAATATAGAARGAPKPLNYLDYLPAVKLIRDDCPLRLEKSAYRIENPSAFRAMIPGQHLTSTNIFPGPRAAIRVATATPGFEVRFPANMPIAGSIFLFRLNVDSGRRELERERERPEENAWGRAPRSPRHDDPISLSVEAAPADDSANHGMALYSVRPLAPLPPGEYVLVLGMGPDYYEFAVDP